MASEAAPSSGSGNEPFAVDVGTPTSPGLPVTAGRYDPSAPFYTMPIEEVAQRCCAHSFTRGISESRVAEYRTVLGDNRIPIKDGRSWIVMLAGHFFNSITVILGIVVIISAVFKDWAEFGVVLFVIIFNGLLGFYQEMSAEKSLASLKSMTAGVAKVLRDGSNKVIPVDDLVVGDIVVLEQGAAVPADLRLIETSNLEIDEGMLTGESLPVSKHTNAIPDPESKCALGDRKNLAFRQTVVTNGRGKGIVCCAGLHTQMGKLAATLTDDSGSSETPLQRKMKLMMWALFGVCIILAIVVFSVNEWDMQSTVILYACAVAIAIIPESLTVVITVAMSISVYRMAQQKCIVRKIAALEVLGNVTDICSDKTGTLTENKMVTSRIVMGLTSAIEVSGAPLGARGTFTRGDDYVEVANSSNPLTTAFMQSCALCSTTHMRPLDHDRSMLHGTGNPTEIAIQVMTWKAQANRERFLHRGWTKVAEFPFDSTIKRMSVAYVNHNDGGKPYLCSKGAPERMIALCTNYMAEDGALRPLGEHERGLITFQISQLAALGLRTICITQRNVSGDEFSAATDFGSVDRATLERDLVYLGLVGIYDPPRPESRSSVLICKHAGIKVRMLTGDHTDTARAIATQLTIVNPATATIETNVIAGPDFDKLTEEQEDRLGDLPSVVGRCSPESKVKMIKALHRRGRIVAMTGDGFNDSPSIKIADIGCAMGSGTDVTKGVADIVITDDNFATIVKAVAEGRRISSSIRKFVIHLLSSNVAEIIVLILGLPIMQDGRSVFLLSPIEILTLNMLTGSPCATGLSLDEADPDTLHVPPNTDGFFSKELILDTFAYGTFLGVPALCSFIVIVFGFNDGLEGKDCNKPAGEGCDVIWAARAAVFTVVHCGLLLHAYNVRHPRKSIFHMKWFDNHWLTGAMIFGVLVLIPILYVEPVATNVYVHKMLTWEWAVVVVALLIFMAFSELYKLAKNRFMPLNIISVPDDETSVDLEFAAQLSARDNRPLEVLVNENLSASFAAMSMRAETPTF